MSGTDPVRMWIHADFCVDARSLRWNHFSAASETTSGLTVCAPRQVVQALRSRLVVEERDKPLAIYIYSGNQDNVQKILDRTSSGGVTVNGVFSHYLENRLPFGGVNQSGMGSYHGYFGFKAFSHDRAVYMHQDAA